MIGHETNSSYFTINRIIEEYYIQNDDLKGLEEYKKQKNSNKGSTEFRNNARAKREEVANYNVVTNKAFLLLPPEQQKLQLIMKIRKEELKIELSENNSVKSALISDELVGNKIKNITKYFKSKNNPASGKLYFSDEDVRYIIFRYPTIINRLEETLEEKLQVLISYNNIDEETAYEMIKRFPAIMGYNVTRTKRQLDLLEQEGLTDSVILNPITLTNSVELLYAMIQYAKEQYNTDNLRTINRKNIFKTGDSKRAFGMSKEQLKAKYPYNIEEKEQDKEYIISPEEIAKTSYFAIERSEEARKVLVQSILNEKGETIK